MKQVSIFGIFFTVGLLVFLKIFQGSVPRISEPITNILVFICTIIVVMIYGISKIKKGKKL